MSTLDEKFSAFEAQVGTQHTALVTALAATNTKLDTLISLFGGTPPTPTVDLADVLYAIQASNTVLAQIHLDTISMDQKLLRIRDAINPLDESLPSEAQSSMPWLLYRIMDAINPTWPRPTSVPAQPALSLLLALSQVQLPNLATIHAALGNPSGDATTTALGLLASIQYSNAGIYADTGTTTGPPRTILDLLSKQGSGCPCASPNATVGGCASPYRSGEMALAPWSLIPGYSSLMFARFLAAPPAGVSYGTVFGIATDKTELTSSNWAGWKFYCASDQSQCSINPTSLTRYPCNTWVDMPSGAGDYAWSVSDRGGLTVTLCPPGQSTSEDCMEMSTVFISDEGCYFSQWPTGWGTQNGYGTGHWLHAELSGYKIWSDDPTGFRVIYSPNVDNSGYSSAALPGAGVDNAFVLPSGTKSVSLNSSSAFGGDSSAFLFTICPPNGGVLPPATLPS